MNAGPAPVGDGMDGVRQHLASVIITMKEQGKIRHLNDWCQRAGMTNSGRIVAFLAGEIRSPSLLTLMKMAQVVDLPVSALIGDVVARDDLLKLAAEYMAAAPDAERRAFMADLLREAAVREESPPEPHDDVKPVDWRSPPGPAPDGGKPRRTRPKSRRP